MKVSAIVSTYNAQKYIKGCLQNLIDQTLFKSGLLEIVVIDSGSEEDEGKTVSDFQSKYRNINYLRTPHRESLYAAWNRGISLAKGRYLTNANTDDRHDENCLEELANALDNNHEIDLVYGDVDKVFSLDTQDSIDNLPCPSQSFFPASLFLHYPFGAQPMWRSKLHKNIGLFNANYDVIGDYEFALRLILKGVVAKHITGAKGKMLWHQEALSTNESRAINEKRGLIENHLNKSNIVSAYESSSLKKKNVSSHEFYKQCLLDLGLRSLCFFPQFAEGKPKSNLSFFRWVVEQNPEDPHLINNLGLYDLILGNEISPKFLQAAASSKCQIMQHNKRIINDKNFDSNFLLFGPNLNWPTESQLSGIKSPYLSFYKFPGLVEDATIPTYSFDLKKFHESFIGEIDFENLKTHDCIYIWGINEKAKLLLSYIDRFDDSPEITLMDSNPATQPVQGLEVYEPENILAKPIRSNCVFFLCMDSIHWELVEKRISESIKHFTVWKIP